MEQEEEVINDLADRIKRIQIKAQEKARKLNPTAPIERGFHARGAGVKARFQVRRDVPEQLRVGLFREPAEYDALVRFSNAKSEVVCDLSKDQRGITIRLNTIMGETLTPHQQTKIQDFLMTNTPVSFARGPMQLTKSIDLEPAIPATQIGA